MGLEDPAAVKEVADEHGSGVVVLLGTPEAESTQTLARPSLPAIPPMQAHWPESRGGSWCGTCSSRT